MQLDASTHRHNCTTLANRQNTDPTEPWLNGRISNIFLGVHER